METAYAYKNTKDVLMKSSSGGAFWGIAEVFFKVGDGFCYGAKFDSDFNVIHSSADSLEKCATFQGSKYVQSDISGCFDEISNLLSEGKRVLFTGTPCQVASIKKYILRKNINTEKLYTVDIVCHGTPDPNVWNDFVQYLQKRFHSKLKSFSFRYKPIGWKGYPIYAEFMNNHRYINTIEISSYQNMFRKNILMKKGCFKCPYPGHFESDLTICDFWGVELCMPQIDTKGGVSVIQVHSEKGRRIVCGMKNKPDVFIQEIKDDKYKKYNQNLVKATECPDNYDVFWKDYKNNGIEYVLCKYGDKNLIGKIKFYIKNILRRSGLADKAKKMLKKA